MATKSLEAFKFQTLVSKYVAYNETLAAYKSQVETYNNAVSDKYLKKAAAEEAFDVFNPLKADMTDKFHKDLEVYMSFASGAAEGNCGLTDCEMTAVCSFEMQYHFSDYHQVRPRVRPQRQAPRRAVLQPGRRVSPVREERREERRTRAPTGLTPST